MNTSDYKSQTLNEKDDSEVKPKESGFTTVSDKEVQSFDFSNFPDLLKDLLQRNNKNLDKKETVLLAKILINLLETFAKNKNDLVSGRKYIHQIVTEEINPLNKELHKDPAFLAENHQACLSDSTPFLHLFKIRDEKQASCEDSNQIITNQSSTSEPEPSTLLSDLEKLYLEQASPNRHRANCIMADKSPKNRIWVRCRSLWRALHHHHLKKCFLP